MAPLHREGENGNKKPVFPGSKASGNQNQTNAKGMPQPPKSNPKLPMPGAKSTAKPTLPSKPPNATSATTPEPKKGLPSRTPTKSAETTPPNASSTERTPFTPLPGQPEQSPPSSVPQKPLASSQPPPMPPPELHAENMSSQNVGYGTGQHIVQQPPAQQNMQVYPPTQQSMHTHSQGLTQGYPAQQQAPPRQQYRPAQASRPRTKKRGNRGTLLMLRYVTLGLLTALVLYGVKTVILPPSIPAPEEIASVVQQELGISSFPEDEAEGFVYAFIRQYLTVGEKNPDRRDELARFGDYTTISGGASYPGGTEQYILEGPYTYGVTQTSPNTAIYTIGANTAASGWVYLAVNIFYDEETRAFGIATAPTYTSPPVTAKVPGQGATALVNEEETAAARNTVSSFFDAWGKSDDAALSVLLTPTADARAHNGLNGTVALNSVNSFEVYRNPAGEGGEDASVGLRPASAIVSWSQGDISYTSHYQVLLYVDAGGKWFIHDILPAQYQPGAGGEE